MNNKSLPLLIFLLTLIFVSCAGQPPTIDIVTPTSAASSSISPTPTATPTYTPTPSATPTPWFTPFDNSSRIATIEALSTKVASYPGHCQPDYSYYSSAAYYYYAAPISPAGEWVIIRCQLPSETRLEVVGLDGKETWVISNTQIHGVLPNISDDYFIIPLHWTHDSEHIYFSIYACCVDSGWPLYGTSWGPLFRLDIQTGKWTTIVSTSRNNPDSNTYSFSTTDRRLIYIGYQLPNQPPSLTILDLKTGATENIPLPEYYDAGEIIWAPDGLSFAFGAAHASEDGQTYSFSVYFYQIETKTLKRLITLSPDMCRPTAVSADSLLTLSCLVFGSEQRVTDHYMQYYDLNTGSLFTPSPTP